MTGPKKKKSTLYLVVSNSEPRKDDEKKNYKKWKLNITIGMVIVILVFGALVAKLWLIGS